MYFATSFNSVAIAVYVVTIFEKECLYKLTFYKAKFRACYSMCDYFLLMLVQIISKSMVCTTGIITGYIKT